MVPNPRGSVGRRVAAWIGIAAVVVAVLVFALWKPGENDKSNAEQTQEDDIDSNVVDTGNAVGDDSNAVNEITVASVELFVVPQRGVQLSVDNSPAQPVPQKIELPAGSHRLVFTSDGYAPEVVSETFIAGTNRVLPVVMKPNIPEVLPSIVGGGKRDSASVAAKPTPPVPNVIPEPSPDRTMAAPPTVEAKGRLAISAAVPVGVYLAGKELGTTPITIELPPGLQTLEYRYQNLSKTASYIIKSNETHRKDDRFRGEPPDQRSAVGTSIYRRA